MKRLVSSVLPVLWLAAAAAFAEQAPLTFWAQRVVDTHVDEQNADQALPEWRDSERILGEPDGAFAALVIHNGWNDWGDLIVDVGSEVGWGELVVVHKQAGPGHAKNTTVYIADESRAFRLLGRVELSETVTESAFPIDTPVRYVQVRPSAGGAVGTDSIWSFDAVGIRIGKAAIGRRGVIEDRALALDAALAKFETDLVDAQKAEAQIAHRWVDAIRDARAALDGVEADAFPAALAAVDGDLDKLDAALLRIAAMPALAQFNADHAPAYVATWTDTMAKHRGDESFRAEDLRFDNEISLARNEYEAAQLVIIAGDTALEDVDITLDAPRHTDTDETLEVRNISVEQLNCVRVNGELWPDPILSFDNLDVPAGGRQSIWIRVYAPTEALAGRYNTHVRIRSSNAHAITLPLRIRVYDFTVPTTAHTKHLLGCGAGGVCEVKLRNHVPTGGGPCTGSVAEPKYILREDGSIAIDFSEYDKTLGQALAMGLTTFGLPLSAGDGGGLIESRLHRQFLVEQSGETEDVSLNPLGGAEAEARFAQWLQMFTTHLRDKGWFDRCFFYLWDEPDLKYTEDLVAIGRAVKKAVPDLKILSVSAPVAAWDEAVDIYCPHVDWFGRQDIDGLLADAEARGKEIWWYNCGNPFPYPTYSIATPATCARMSFLLMWQYGIAGNLYWCADVNNDLRQSKGINVGSDGRGDGQLVYRDVQGRTASSMRLEMIRDGVEDYEYLWLLNERMQAARTQDRDVTAAETLLGIPDEVARDIAHYTHDPQPLEHYREQVARAIEQFGESR